MKPITAPVLLFALALALVQGCATKNIISEGGDNVMLKGHDPVAYFAVGRPVPGRPEIKATHEDVTYYFSSDANRQEFMQRPEKYAPRFGGFCANGIVYGIPWGGEPDAWQIIDGELYIFGSQNAKKYFLMDEERNLQLADRYWDTEMKTMSSAFAQRVKRLIARVPHYKTGDELKAEWQARQAKN